MHNKLITTIKATVAETVLQVAIMTNMKTNASDTEGQRRRLPGTISVQLTIAPRATAVKAP